VTTSCVILGLKPHCDDYKNSNFLRREDAASWNCIIVFGLAAASGTGTASDPAFRETSPLSSGK
jgi:hypothetical protein